MTPSTRDERRSTRCGCGRTKPPFRSFCVICYRTLPGELQAEIRLASGEEQRDRAYEHARDFLAPIWEQQGPVQPVAVPITMTEEQMVRLFLAANIEGKRVAIQALLNWESEHS